MHISCTEEYLFHVWRSGYCCIYLDGRNCTVFYILLFVGCVWERGRPFSNKQFPEIILEVMTMQNITEHSIYSEAADRHLNGGGHYSSANSPQLVPRTHTAGRAVSVATAATTPECLRGLLQRNSVNCKDFSCSKASRIRL
ncbi:UNVERIFIED_CONTAM: hypothetical protein K2H54_016272 [Gekko kuhli]